MTAFFLLPFLMLLVVIPQITLLDVLALRWVNMEISLICVIYAGFRFDAVRGGLMALVLGFFLDCLTSAIFNFDNPSDGVTRFRLSHSTLKALSCEN